jgi:hypothetical protein
MRFALQSDIGYVGGPDQALYRDHDAGMHRSHFSGALADHQQISSVFAFLFRDHPDSIANRHRVAALVRGRLSARALRLAYSEYEREPFDAAEALALEAAAQNKGSNSIQVLLARCRFGLRKRLAPELWRTLQWALNLITIVPRRWNYLQHQRLRRAGLSL